MAFTNFTPPFVPDFGIPSFLRPGGITALVVLYLVGAVTGILIGAGLLAGLLFLPGLSTATTAIFGTLGVGLLILSVVQLGVAFGLFGMRRFAWIGGVALSVIQLGFSVVSIVLGLFLILRPLSLGGVSDFTTDPIVSIPLFGLIAYDVIFGVALSIITIAFLTRRHVRALFGRLRPQDLFPGAGQGAPFGPNPFTPQFGPGGFGQLPPGVPPDFFLRQRR